MRVRMSGADLQTSRYLQARTVQLLAQRDFQSAINCLDQTIRLHSHVSPALLPTLRHFIHSTTQHALDSLRQTYSLTDPSNLLRLLHQLERALSTVETRLIALDFCDLYNSLAAAYRHLPNPHLARSFWKKALSIAQRFPEAAGRRAALCLSLCAVTTELKQHSEALKYAQQGLMLALKRLKARCTGDVVTMVAAGYHNVGVQEERLQHYTKALSSYQQAVHILQTRGDERHISLLSDLKRSLKAASRPNSPLLRPHPPDKSFPKGKSASRRTTPRRECFSVVQSPDPSRNSSFRLAEEDQDLVELQEKGLLEFTRDGEEKGRPRKMRGRRRDVGSRAGRGAISLQTSLQSSPCYWETKEQLQFQAEEAEITWEQSIQPENSLEPLYQTELMVKPTAKLPINQKNELNEGAIVRLQAWVRGCKARNRVKMLISRSIKVVFRTCGKDCSGQYTLAIVTAGKQHYCVTIGAISGSKPFFTGNFPITTALTPLEMIEEVGKLEPAAVLKLQSLFRGYRARLLLRLLRKAGNSGRKELYRTVICVDSAYAACSILKDSAGLWAVIEPWEHAKQTWDVPVPSDFQQLPAALIPAHLQKSSDKYYFPQSPPLSLPLSPPCKPVQPPIRLEEMPSFMFEKQTTTSSDSNAFPQFAKSTGLIKCYVAGTPTARTIPSPVNSYENEGKGRQIRTELTVGIETAVIRLQTASRKWLAKRRFLYMRLRKQRPLLYRGFHGVAKPAIALVSMWELEGNVEIACESLGVSMRIGRTELPNLGLREPYKYADLATRLYVQDGTLAIYLPLADMIKFALVVQKYIRGFLARNLYKNLKAKTKRRLVLVRRKAASAEVFYVSIYQTGEKVQVEAFKLYERLTLKYRQQSVYYTIRELEEMYGYLPSFDIIIDDLELTPNSMLLRPRRRLLSSRSLDPLSPLTPRPPLDRRDRYPRPCEQRSILRTSLKLDSRLWVITASVVRERVEFRAFCSGCQHPLSTQCPISTLCRKVGLSDVIPASMVAIHHMLKLEKEQLVCDLDAEVPDVHRQVAYIQACIRGFLVRRHLGPISKGNLLACKVTMEEDGQWVLYAYSESGTIRVEAVKRRSTERMEIHISSVIFVRFPPNLSHKRVIESFIFPKLTIAAADDSPQLRMSNTSHLDSLLEKHKDKIKVISSAPRMYIDCKDQAIKALIDQSGSETDSPTLNRQNALQLMPIAYDRSKEDRKKETPANFSTLSGLNSGKELLKEEIERDGVHYQATVYRDIDGYRVELVSGTPGKTLAVLVPAQSTSKPEAEELLTRVQVGTQGLTIAPSEVRYKQHHYISNRYYCVTISSAAQGLEIVAFDPMLKSTLSLLYKRTNPGEALETEEALAEIVSRLKVQGSGSDAYLLFV